MPTGPMAEPAGADALRRTERAAAPRPPDRDGARCGRGNPAAASRRLGRGILVSALLAGSAARAAEVLPPGRYEVVTEIGMPHLEENLRYAATREERCLTDQALAGAFPILLHPSLAGCALEREARRDATVSYDLVCAGGNGTTGRATWQLGEPVIRGTLDVRMGGKNMTFSQRVTARPLGACTAGAE